MGSTAKQKQSIIIILLVGIIMGMAFSGRYMSKSWSFDAFYDVGNVYEEFTFWFYQGAGIVYNDETKQVEVQQEDASQHWILPLNLKDYQYFVLELGDISSPDTEVLFQFYSGETLVKEVPLQLKNGKNILDVTDITANIMYMRLYQKQGLSYEVKSIQYREYITEWDSRTFWTVSLLGCLCCISVLFWVRWIFGKKNIRLSIVVFINKLQRVFLKISEKIGGGFLSKKATSFWRKILFFFLISFMNYGERTGMSRQVLSRNIKIFCIALVIIAVLSLEKKIKMRNWGHPLAVSWFWMLAGMSISFLIVPKRADVGIIYLLVFGFFFFVWGNMERPQEMLHDLCAVIKCEFWFSMAYFCIFYPEYEGYAYQGAFHNPNTLAMYNLAPFCVFLAELVAEKEEKLCSKAFSALGLGISICMIWKTQCRSVIGGVGVSILISGYMILRRRFLKTRSVCIFRRFVLMLFIIAGIILADVGVNVFPVQDNLEDVSNGIKQKKQGDIFTLSAKAAQISSNKFIQKILTSKSLDDFTSGRIIYWKAYLRQMNFWGHEFWAVINGKRYPPHNGFLSIAYQYGVLSVIPYLFYLFYFLVYGYRYFKNKRGVDKYAGYPLLLVTCVFPFLLLDNLEYPFRYEAWLALYLTTGVLLENREIVPNKEEWLNTEETAIVESGQDGLKKIG